MEQGTGNRNQAHNPAPNDKHSYCMKSKVKLTWLKESVKHRIWNNGIVE